jgi:hypothetical protein
MMDVRHEGVVRMDAEMHSLVMRGEAVKTRVEAMKQANRNRESQGLAQAYGEECFWAAETDLIKIADELAKL